MPNIVAHCWYGDVAITKANTDRLRKIVNRNHGVFMFGCQGPDPFYFYHRLPWQDQKNIKAVRDYGNTIHKHHISGTFRVFLDITRETQNEEDIAFVAGFMNHWALDHICHPYIFYETDSLTEDIGNYHQVFETMIDKGVLDVNGLKRSDCRTSELLKHPKDAFDRIYEIYKRVFKELDNMDIEKEHVTNSYETFYGMQRVFYDPKGSKYKWVGILENMVKAKGLATSMMIPNEYDDVMDPMNFRHEEWIDPCDNTKKSTESFTDLASKAAGIAIRLMELYDQFLEGKNNGEEILEIIGEKGYDTGMEFSIKKKYFKRDLLKNEEGKN